MQPGDVVYLRSGGPNMTIRWINAGEANCEWFDSNSIKNATFVLTSLVKYTES